MHKKIYYPSNLKNVSFDIDIIFQICYSPCFVFLQPSKEVKMGKIYKITLTTEERQELLGIVSTGKSNAQRIKHANILLAVDEVANAPLTDQEAARRFHCHVNTVANIRARFVEQGVSRPLSKEKSVKHRLISRSSMVGRKPG
jgi:hypothetical protein